VLQNASKCTILMKKNTKIFLRRGHSALARPHPIGAFNTSIRVPWALEPPKPHFWLQACASLIRDTADK